MITEKPKQIEINELVDVVIFKLGHLRDLLVDMAKNGEASTEDKWNEVVMFSPDEWEDIALTIQHFNHFMKEVNKLEDQNDIDDYYDKNKSMLSLVHDLSCHWYSRIEEMKKENNKA